MLILVLRSVGLGGRRDLPLVRKAVEDTKTKRGVPEYLIIEVLVHEL